MIEKRNIASIYKQSVNDDLHLLPDAIDNADVDIDYNYGWGYVDDNDYDYGWGYVDDKDSCRDNGDFSVVDGWIRW